MPRERPRQWLAEGNYIRLAKSAVDPKNQGIAAVLVGNHRAGLAKLQRALPDPDVNYYQAFAHWCLNDPASANAVLDDADPRHAKFKSILNRKVKVLCQARHDGDVAWCLSSELKKNPAFEVVTIGNMAMDDIQLGVNETMESVLNRLGDWRPDFYFVHMVEYRLIPIGVERAPFPVIFQSSDHRTDYQQVIPLLDLCDGVMVLGEQAHRELSSATKSRVFTYPKLFGVHCETAQNAMVQEKEFDVFWSGNMLDESFYDKATFFSHLADALGEKHKLILCNGKTRLDEYYNLLARARAVPSYIHREQDSFSSRALEAIAMGAMTLVPAGNAIGLYFDERSGLIEFHPANAEAAIQNVLDNWDNYYAKSAAQGRLRALAEFNFPDVVSGLFKFLLLESLNMSIQHRHSISTARSDYRLYGRIEASEVFANPQKLLDYSAQTLVRLKAAAADTKDIDVLSVIAHLAWGTEQPAEAVETLERIYETAPRHIGALFNLGYAYFYTGRHDEAMQKFQALIELNSNDADISPLFALFDSSSQLYLTHLVRDELGAHFFCGAPIDDALAYLQSVAHNFVAKAHEDKGNMEGALQHLRSAVMCFPENFIAQSNLGRFLARRGGECAEARTAHIAAIETYRGYLLTDVFELFLETTDASDRQSEQLVKSRDQLRALIAAGQQLQTKGQDAWLTLFGTDSKNNAGVRLLHGGAPQLLEEGYKGFNIVRYGSTFYGLAQGVGAIDLTVMTDDALRQLKDLGHCLSAKSIEELKVSLETRDIAAHIEQLATTLLTSLDRGDHVTASKAIAVLQEYAAHDANLSALLAPIFEQLAKRSMP